jgi:hypothetical protein
MIPPPALLKNSLHFSGQLAIVAAGLLVCAFPVRGKNPEPTQPPGAILAHWSFDADTIQDDKVLDGGPRQFEATIRSQNDVLPETAPGIRGEALRFPSGHEAWIALDRDLTLRPPFTIAAWVKLDGRRGTMELVGQKAHSSKEGFRIVFSVRQFLFEYGDGSESIFVRYDPHQTQVGQWVFLAVVHDGETIALYLDGEELRREPARPAAWSSKPMLLGNYIVHKNDYRFLGTIDEFMILEEALDGPALAALGRWALTGKK